ncbi:hypothetical protein GE061_018697 [Apolygus lucorum]|nr:hypothetical protein GE061_018697 [Apolygus lucorum]
MQTPPAAARQAVQSNHPHTMQHPATDYRSQRSNLKRKVEPSTPQPVDRRNSSPFIIPTNEKPPPKKSSYPAAADGDVLQEEWEDLNDEEEEGAVGGINHSSSTDGGGGVTRKIDNYVESRNLMDFNDNDMSNTATSRPPLMPIPDEENEDDYPTEITITCNLNSDYDPFSDETLKIKATPSILIE